MCATRIARQHLPISYYTMALCTRPVNFNLLVSNKLHHNIAAVACMILLLLHAWYCCCCMSDIATVACVILLLLHAWYCCCCMRDIAVAACMIWCYCLTCMIWCCCMPNFALLFHVGLNSAIAHMRHAVCINLLMASFTNSNPYQNLLPNALQLPHSTHLSHVLLYNHRLLHTIYSRSCFTACMVSFNFSAHLKYNNICVDCVPIS